MWVSECSDASNRGRRVLLQGFFAIGGLTLASWIEFGLYFIKDSEVNFRFPIAFQVFFALIFTSTVLFLPESPRWLVKKDRVEDANAVMCALEDMPEDSEVVNMEMQIIQETFQEERRDSSSIFHMGPERQFHRACLAIAAAVLAQMTGINIVTFYSTQIFETQLKYSAIDARIFSGCIQIWQFISAGIAVLLIDRFGRRKLLMAGALGMTIAQAALCGLNSDLTNPAAGKAAIFFFFWAMFWFPVGLLLIPFMYAAEIAPLSIRHKVTAISACSNWLFNFLIAEVTPHAMKNIGWRYYIVYTCISAFAFVVHYYFFPETKGRTLEEIDEIFIRSKSIFDPVRVEKALPHGGLVGMERRQDEEKHAAVHAENV
jgi:sugar porter (SP) family MFS transporter